MKVVIRGSCDLHRALINLAEWGEKAKAALDANGTIPQESVEDLVKLYSDPESSKILSQVAMGVDSGNISLMGSDEEELGPGEVLLSHEFFGAVVDYSDLSKALRVFK